MIKDYFQSEHDAILQTYKRLPIVVDYAFGARIFDLSGNSYLDFLGGIAVNALGHCHPRTIEAIEKQIRKYMHVSNYFYQPAQIELAEKLKEFSGYDKVFYSNSGTEAIEGALKLVKRWGNQNGKNEVIAFTGGFHGRTYGALSIMDKPLYKDGMEPFLPNCKVIDYNNIEELNKNINDKTTAIFIEFIQGEGGIASVSDEFVAKINELKTKFGFLVVADEIQCGTGRTGRFFGFEHYDIKPDIVTMAKGIGGALPLGCILTDNHLADVFEKGMHGTTYGGNAVACAAGMSVLEELENGLQDEVIRIGEYLKNQLLDIQTLFPDKILEVRGKGLMAGLLLRFDASILVEKLLAERIITNAASGKVLRLIPPLIIKEKEVDDLTEALKKILLDIH
jgi:predicted acetylornithine/succinylornithine family transaminase